jgi:hypothetical protein
MLPIAAEAAGNIADWRRSATGHALLAADTEDLAGDLEDLHRTLSTTAARAEARVDIADDIRIELVERDAPAAPPLAGNPLLQLVPGDALYVGVDGTRSLGDSIGDAFVRGEDRLAKNWMKAWAKGDEADEAKWSEWSREYYASFATTRELVREARTIFVPPYAFVIARNDPPSTLSITTPSMPDVRVRVPDIAFIGKPATTKAGLAWLDALANATASGIFRVAGRAPIEGSSVATDEDLGLGVPTRSLHADWLGAAVPGWGVKAGEGAGLHAFAHGDLMVISSSVALSKRIQAGAGASAIVVDPGVVAQWSFDGSACADTLLAVFDEAHPLGDELAKLGRFSASLCGAIARMSSTTRDLDDTRRTSIVVTFADPS